MVDFSADSLLRNDTIILHREYEFIFIRVYRRYPEGFQGTIIFAKMAYSINVKHLRNIQIATSSKNVKSTSWLVKI